MNSLGNLTARTLQRCILAASALGLAAASAWATDYPSTILADHPSAYYRFEELPGASTAVDSSPNGVNATYYENSEDTSPLLGVAGIDTNSILFNGGSSDYGYVDIPGSDLISPAAADGTNSGAFSAELWVEPTAYPSTWTVPLEVAAYPAGWNIYVSGPGAGNPAGQSYFYLDMRPSLFQGEGGFLIQFLQWYHLVVTFDGTNAMFYINGVPNGPYNASGFVPALGSDAHVGSGQGAGWGAFIGGVDEVAFYTNVLTAAQVLNHYTVGTNSFRVSTNKPAIVSNPDSTTNFSGLDASFTVSASGTAPLHYFWSENGTNVGTDANSLTLPIHYPADNNAQIQVIVSNFYGTATSSIATLTVSPALNIVASPQSITRNVGSYAAFHVTADGAVPIAYQWAVSANGGTSFQNIVGATNDTLWLSNVQASLSANVYSVAVSNPFTNSTESATLTVQPRTDTEPPLTGYASFIIADHPVAYWRLDESSGASTAVDAVGTFDGTYTANSGAITYGVKGGVPDSLGDTAVTLANGATIQVPWAPELNPDTAWSVESWLNPSSLGANGGDYRVVLSSEYNEYPNPYNGWYVYQQPNNTFAFVPQPANGFIVAAPDDPANNNLLVANKWYHLVITDDLTNFNVYINGELRSSFPVSGLQFIPDGDGINPDGSAGLGGADGGNFVIGQRTDGAFNTFEGSVDDTAVYNYALTPLQVATHYSGGVSLSLTRSGASITLNWSSGTLQQATAVNGPYSDVAGAAPGYTVPASNSQVFYRVHVP